MMFRINTTCMHIVSIHGSVLAIHLLSYNDRSIKKMINIVKDTIILSESWTPWKMICSWVLDIITEQMQHVFEYLLNRFLMEQGTLDASVTKNYITPLIIYAVII